MSGGFEVRLRPAAVRDFDNCPPMMQRRIAHELDRLAVDPFHIGAITLTGGLRPYRRARVGDYRVVYHVEQQTQTVCVALMGQRKDVYQRLSHDH